MQARAAGKKVVTADFRVDPPPLARPDQRRRRMGRGAHQADGEVGRHLPNVRAERATTGGSGRCVPKRRRLRRRERPSLAAEVRGAGARDSRGSGTARAGGSPRPCALAAASAQVADGDSARRAALTRRVAELSPAVVAQDRPDLLSPRSSAVPDVAAPRGGRPPRARPSRAAPSAAPPDARGAARTIASSCGFASQRDAPSRGDRRGSPPACRAAGCDPTARRSRPRRPPTARRCATGPRSRRTRAPWRAAGPPCPR